MEFKIYSQCVMIMQSSSSCYSTSEWQSCLILMCFAFVLRDFFTLGPVFLPLWCTSILPSTSHEGRHQHFGRSSAAKPARLTVWSESHAHSASVWRVTPAVLWQSRCRCPGGCAAGLLSLQQCIFKRGNSSRNLDLPYRHWNSFWPAGLCFAAFFTAIKF